MYRIDFSGCLVSIFILLVIGYLIKELWWLIVGIIVILIVLFYANLIYYNISSKKAEKDANYDPEMGEVYKVCPYCSSKVKVTATVCPVCNHELN
ncbi:hypothetical protein IJD44_04350 [bacterium]|nr:hypothetical protein [bacterium]